MKNLITSDSIQYKAKYDGFDLYKSNPSYFADILKYAISKCVIHPDNINNELLLSISANTNYSLIQKELGLNASLAKKYEVFTFTTNTQEINCNHVIFDTDIDDLTFIGMPSYDIDGILNNISFRLIDFDRIKINHAFKWLFLCGNSSTFGLNHINKSNKDIILVEGAWDYIALNELGYENVVSLGSIFMSDIQKGHLTGYNIIPCFDADNGGIQQAFNINTRQYYTYTSEKLNGLDPFDMWIENKELSLLLNNYNSDVKSIR